MTIPEAAPRFAYHDLFDHDARPQIIYSTRQNRILDANQAARRMYGYSAAEIRELPLSALRRQADYQHPSRFRNHSLIGYAGTSYRCWHKKKNGHAILVEETLLMDNHAHVPFFVISVRQIKEEHTPFELLHDAYQKYQFIARRTAQAIYDWNLIENTIQWEGARFHAFFDGQGPQSLQQWLKLLHPADQAAFCDSLEEVIWEGSPSDSWEITCQQKDRHGRYLHVRNTARILKDADGKAHRIIGALNQVQQQMPCLEEVKRNERKYNIIFQKSPIPKFICSKDQFRIENRNAAAVRFLEGVGEPDFSLLELFSEPDRAVLLRLLQEDSLATPASLGEWNLHSLLGEETKKVEVFVAPLPAEDHDRFLFMFSDGTELSRTQEQYKNLYLRYQLALQATSDVIWDYDFTKDELEWGDNFEEKFGFSSHQYACVEDWMQHIHPEDRSRVADSMQALIKGKQGKWQAVFRFQRVDGTWIHLQSRAMMERTLEGHPKRLVGAAKDITEKVRYITELEERNQSLKEIAWDQSHLVRAPLARIKSLVDLIQTKNTGEKSLEELLQYIGDSVEELDEIVKDVVRKSNYANRNL